MQKNLKKTGDGSVIFRLAIPVIVSQISLTFVQIVDSMFIGRLGAVQLGAIALIGVFIWNLLSVGEGFSVGLTACIARMIGGKKYQEASLFFRSGMIGILLLGIVLLPILLIFRGPLFTAVRMPEEMILYGTQYYVWFIYFLPFIFLLTAAQAAYRAAGDTRTPMYIGIFMNGLNIFLDYGLIFGKLGFPALGMKGAAIASGISYAAGWIILLGFSSRKQWGPFRPGRLFTFSHFRRIIRLGIPSTIERLTMSISQLFAMTISVNPLGSMYIASFHIVMRLASLSFMPGFGFAISAATISGQKLGEGKPEEAARLIWLSVFYCALVMACISVIYFSIPDFLVRLFINDETIVALTKSPLRIYALMVVFLAPTMVLGNALRGAGDTTYPMIIMFISRLAIRIPFSWLLGIYWGLGLNGIWIAMCSDFLIRGILLIFRMRGGKWKSIRI